VEGAAAAVVIVVVDSLCTLHSVQRDLPDDGRSTAARPDNASRLGSVAAVGDQSSRRRRRQDEHLRFSRHRVAQAATRRVMRANRPLRCLRHLPPDLLRSLQQCI